MAKDCLITDLDEYLKTIYRYYYDSEILTLVFDVYPNEIQFNGISFALDESYSNFGYKLHPILYSIADYVNNVLDKGCLFEVLK